MSIEKPKDERRELYDAFRAELKGGGGIGFYDEADLVEIYDQAADLEDEYTKIEVLMVGARLYPQSEQLAARKGFLYYSLGMDDGVTDTINSRGTGSVLWQVLQLRENNASDQEIISRLEKLLADNESLDDEAIIQVVDLASTDAIYQWIKQNEGVLRTKTDYLPTLLYELYIMGEYNEDNEYAIQKLEELTEIDPFTLDYWVILSELYVKAGNVEGALSAADYALAINSGDVSALVAKADAMTYVTPVDSQGMKEMLEPLISDEMTDPKVLKLYAAALIDIGQADEAKRLIMANLKDNPTWREVIDVLLFLDVDDAYSALKAYNDVQTQSEGESVRMHWAMRFYEDGNYTQAAVLIDDYVRQYGCEANGSEEGLSTANMPIYYSALYAAEMYPRLVEIFQATLADEKAAEKLTPELVMTGLLSLLRLGRLADAKRDLDRVVALHPLRSQQQWGVDSVLKAIGYSTMMGVIGSTIRSAHSQVDLTDIDPLMPRP